MAAINADTDKPRTITPAASTRKRSSTSGRDASGGDAELGPEIYVRDASHYQQLPTPQHDSGQHDGEMGVGR